MKYSQGSFGRVFVLKFEDKDNLLEEMKRVVLKEKIEVGTITLLGGMRYAAVVYGHKERVLPPDPTGQNFTRNRPTRAASGRTVRYTLLSRR